MSASPAPPSGTPFAMSIRVLAGSLMGALLFMGVALFFVLPLGGTPPVWVFLALLVAGVAVHVLLEAIGYRVQALDPSMTDGDAAAAARARWHSTMILRFALSEVVAGPDGRARVDVGATHPQDRGRAGVRRAAVPPARGVRPLRAPQTMSGALTRASSASWSVDISWLCFSASTRRR